jgi:alpha-tubulin suppressor-like RCC1 family protein
MPTTNFKNSSGTDIGNTLVEKSYLIDRYPELADTFKQAGLWLWGYHLSGSLGDGTTSVHKSSPIQTASGGTNWQSIGVGMGSSAAIKTDGTLWTWGRNDYGELGDGTTAYKSTPVKIGSDTNWKMVGMGQLVAAGIKTDGTLWTWGRGDYGGMLGDNTLVDKPSPVQTIAGGTNWKSLSVGNYGIAAIKTDGTLWTWGKNPNGFLGDGTTADRSSPVQVAGTTWKIVSCGARHMSAIKTDGTLWVWGENGNYGYPGILGDGTSTGRSSPVQTIAAGTNWKSVSASWFGVAAIKTDGTLWSWGYNGEGQMGDGTTTLRSSPVQTISAGTNWKIVQCGGYITKAIKTDGTLWAWGANSLGGIGDGTTTNRSSPVQIGGTNWKQIGGGYYTSAAIRDDSADIFGNTL